MQMYEPFSLHLLDILLLSGGKSGRFSIVLTAVTIFFSTLVIGGAGSVMLELYGWESVFYISGILAVLWAYCMWKCMLKGEGNCSNMTDWYNLSGLVHHFDTLLRFDGSTGNNIIA